MQNDQLKYIQISLAGPVATCASSHFPPLYFSVLFAIWEVCHRCTGFVDLTLGLSFRLKLIWFALLCLSHIGRGGGGERGGCEVGTNTWQRRGLSPTRGDTSEVSVPFVTSASRGGKKAVTQMRQRRARLVSNTKNTRKLGLFILYNLASYRTFKKIILYI